jgi:hypothetical protein
MRVTGYRVEIVAANRYFVPIPGCRHAITEGRSYFPANPSFDILTPDFCIFSE